MRRLPCRAGDPRCRPGDRGPRARGRRGLGRVNGPSVAVVASRIRAEEKRILAALDRRAVRYVHIDSRTLWSFTRATAPSQAILNREIGHTRALYAARTLEALGSVVVNSATATEICGDKWRTS